MENEELALTLVKILIVGICKHTLLRFHFGNVCILCIHSSCAFPPVASFSFDRSFKICVHPQANFCTYIFFCMDNFFLQKNDKTTSMMEWNFLGKIQLLELHLLDGWRKWWTASILRDVGKIKVQFWTLISFTIGEFATSAFLVKVGQLKHQ